MWPESDELLSGILSEKPGQGLGDDWDLAHDVVKEQCLWDRETVPHVTLPFVR